MKDVVRELSSVLCGDLERWDWGVVRVVGASRQRGYMYIYS